MVHHIPPPALNAHRLRSDLPVHDPANVAVAAQQQEVYVGKRCLGSRPTKNNWEIHSDHESIPFRARRDPHKLEGCFATKLRKTHEQFYSSTRVGKRICCGFQLKYATHLEPERFSINTWCTRNSYKLIIRNSSEHCYGAKSNSQWEKLTC